MLLDQKIRKRPHPRGHGRAADEYRVDRLAVIRVEGFEQRHQFATLEFPQHAERADARDARGGGPGG